MDKDGQVDLQADGIAVPPKRIIMGIPCFDELPEYDDHIFNISFQRMHDLTLLSRKVGWKQAILEEISETDEWLAHYIVSPLRTFFLSIIEIREGEKILDAGAGWGSISAQIAKGFPDSKVYAFDKSLETLLFADQIKRQEGLGNMRILQGDITNPPFEKNFFDLIIMMGTLAWIGTSSQNTSPETVQKRALTAMREILKPKGTLLIGIENRIGYKYFLGKRDEHSGLRFTNLMPRSVAELYMKLRGRKTYRAYTYTRRGYEQLLKNAGFRDIRFYFPFPHYAMPQGILDLAGAKELAIHENKHGARILPWHSFRTFANSFYIIARRNE